MFYLPLLLEGTALATRDHQDSFEVADAVQFAACIERIAATVAAGERGFMG